MVGIFLDVSKSFDTINNDVMFNKMNQYVMKGNVLERFTSYLYRQQYFTYDVCSSNTRCIILYLEGHDFISHDQSAYLNYTVLKLAYTEWSMIGLKT